MIGDPKDMSWWPDLSDRRIAIVGAGPSLTRHQIDRVHAMGCYIIAVNESWRLAPMADVHYICDWQYARHKMPRPGDFNGIRILGTFPPSGLPDDMKWMKRLDLKRLSVEPGKNRLIWDTPAIGAGGNSVFQMFNWALRCGAQFILFLGLDCHTPAMHWHGSHDHPEKPTQTEKTLERWKLAFKNAAEDPKLAGVTILNCSPGTALEAFPCVSLEVLEQEAA